MLSTAKNNFGWDGRIIMNKETIELEKVLARIERSEKGLGMKIESFIELQQALMACKDELIVEVEQIKNVRKSLKESVVTALKDNAELIIPKLLSGLVDGFRKKTTALLDSSLEETERLKKGIDHSVSEVIRLIDFQKREMTIRRSGLTLAFCCSSILTGLALFYFFPQHEHVNFHTQNITYGLDDTQLKNLIAGEVALYNFDQLSPKIQTQINDHLREKLKKKHA
jgi:hypothetical protein